MHQQGLAATCEDLAYKAEAENVRRRMDWRVSP
jgi:hypothetical protein